MKKLRRLALARMEPPAQVSVRALAGSVGLSPPFRVSTLIDALLAPRSFHAVITTPSGTALGGTVDVTVFSDGRYTFDVHMHDSGFDPYTFRVRCALQSPGGPIVLFQTSGHTDGTGSNLFGDINRDFDHHEDGLNPMIREFWLDVRESAFAVSKSYDDAGLLSAVEDIAKDVLGFLIADVTLGAGLALVISASAALSDSLDASFVGTGGIVGVLVAGGVIWVYGPSAITAAVVAGVAAGAITDASFRHRLLTDDEYAFADTVFQGTLPPREKIFVTNLSHDGGRKYTWPNLDGSVLLNLNDAFDDPMHFADPSYTTRGQVLIHELTHAWQIWTKSFVPGILCKSVFGPGSYDYGPAGPPWSDFGLEQQAAIVDHWFGKYAGMWNTTADVIANLGSQAALHDPYFGYINGNIRLGQN